MSENEIMVYLPNRRKCMNIYSTGNQIVDEIGQINFTGNIIPKEWFATVVKANGKPNLRAIMFLADIVYWYRPTEKRDEATGNLVCYAKKMKGDMLQRSYKHLMEQFGCSKTEATTTIVELEKLGVIKREFRTEVHNGVCSNNIMYIDLNVDVLKSLTFPQIADEVRGDTPMHKNLDSSPSYETTPLHKNMERVSIEKEIAPPDFMETNTETISKITTKISHKNTQSINQVEAPKNVDDGLSEDEIKEIVEDDFLEEKVIPYSYHANERKMLVAIKILTDWYELASRHFNSDFEYVVYDMLVGCLADMACADGNQTYKGSTVTYAMVIDQINAVVHQESSLYNFAEQTVDDYMKAAGREEIRDKRKYMKSVIWNSFLTYRVKFESDFALTHTNA